jgi:hypothetical protein
MRMTDLMFLGLALWIGYEIYHAHEYLHHVYPAVF